MILEPKDARVCILDDDVPDLAGIARLGVGASDNERGHVKRGWACERRAEEQSSETLSYTAT